MRLEEIRADGHPEGHRIDIAWRNPDPAGFPGMRVVRRERTHPTDPGDGVIVADGLLPPLEIDERGGARHRVSDVGLKSDTVYYYSLFPVSSGAPDFSIDRANRIAALSTAARDTAAQMYALLPALYRRYDAATSQLRAFLDIPGAQLDQLHGFARAVLDAHDLERVDGRLLAVLAEWIGWRTDFRLEIERQRSEIRGAPSIYARVGLLPVVGATVKRISGWESRTKEFVHNVVRSNQPPRLNLWGRRLAADGSTMTPPGGAPDVLLSVDHAYGGGISHATDADGVRWVFYHTPRRGRWRIAYKTSPTFRLGPELRSALETPDIARLQAAFFLAGVTLAATATVTPSGNMWHVDDPTNGESYVVEPAGAALTVYHLTADALTPGPRPAQLSPSYAASRLMPATADRDEQSTAAALQDQTLWLFWSSRNPGTGAWEIRYRLRRDGVWSDARDRLWEPAAAPIAERRLPSAIVDDTGGLWLFFLERVGRRWLLRYNRHDGSGLDVDPATGWQLDPAADFPFDGVADPRVDSDVSLLFHPAAATRSLWVFWARKETASPGQTRWSVAYRVKAGLDPTAADWSAVETLPKPDALAHDREPAARVNADGDVALFWSSDRDGGWSIWQAVVDPVVLPPAWSGVARVTDSPYAERAPLPVALGGDTLLLFRSSESLRYSSDVYRASETVDFRYAGSTTPHVRDAAKLGLRLAFDDAQHYTFDADTAPDDWYRRDTIGVYVAPDTLDEEAIARGIERVGSVLPEFMPVTDRAVFVAQPDTHVEHVYTYDAPGLGPTFIGEAHVDVLTAPLGVDVLDTGTDFSDDFE